MKRSKRKLCLAAAVLTTLLLTGCFGGTEVGERAFVQLMGLERQDGIYTVSLQLYKSESGTPEPDVSKANSVSVSGSGATVQSALADAEIAAGKKIFLGHIKMLIIGGGIENPSDELALFLDGSVSPSCPVAYSDDPAAVTETLLEDGSYSAEQLMTIMSMTAAQGKTVYTSAAKLASDTGVLDCAAILPIVRAEDKSVSFDGLTFARKNGTAGYLPEEDAVGAKLLLNAFESGDKITVPVTADGKKATAFITGAKTCLKAEESADVLTVSADIKLNIYISENPYEIKETLIEQAVRESVRDSCISAFSSAVWYNSCDPFGIKKLVRRDCPGFYERYSENDGSYLTDSSLSVSVSDRLIH